MAACQCTCALLEKLVQPRYRIGRTRIETTASRTGAERRVVPADTLSFEMRVNSLIATVLPYRLPSEPRDRRPTPLDERVVGSVRGILMVRVRVENIPDQHARCVDPRVHVDLYCVVDSSTRRARADNTRPPSCLDALDVD